MVCFGSWLIAILCKFKGIKPNREMCSHGIGQMSFHDTRGQYPTTVCYSFMQDLKSGVKKITNFLKIDIKDDLVDKIVAKCHIGELRKAEKGNDQSKRFLIDGKPLMFRKGTFTYTPNGLFFTCQLDASVLSGILFYVLLYFGVKFFFAKSVAVCGV